MRGRILTVNGLMSMLILVSSNLIVGVALASASASDPAPLSACSDTLVESLIRKESRSPAESLYIEMKNQECMSQKMAIAKKERREIRMRKASVILGLITIANCIFLLVYHLR